MSMLATKTCRSARLISRFRPFVAPSSQRFQSCAQFSTIRVLMNNHSSDSYSKDVDHSPPKDPKTHRVDPGAEASQRPYEPPSGEWSHAGSKTHEYASVSREEPYDAPKEKGTNQERDSKTGYGAVDKRKQGYKGEGVSRSEEGPTGAHKGGRK